MGVLLKLRIWEACKRGTFFLVHPVDISNRFFFYLKHVWSEIAGESLKILEDFPLYFQVVT